MTEEREPKCIDRKSDCTAYCDGNCRILTSTDFGGRKCPFYYSKDFENEEG